MSLRKDGGSQITFYEIICPCRGGIR